MTGLGNSKSRTGAGTGLKHDGNEDRNKTGRDQDGNKSRITSRSCFEGLDNLLKICKETRLRSGGPRPEVMILYIHYYRTYSHYISRITYNYNE